ncbi:hypothetical protein [Pseudophaeobacter sp. C1-32P7]|uniref:hypothetical protein n=1 Tax=Pseudophaeobacter sp. C1-32P7 TaxID=3098142 RepID=UPI0034D6ABF0
MKLETLSALSSGIFATAGSWLLANGSSLPILVMALIGAVIAVLDLEEPTIKKAGSLIVFNTAVGTFGGPVLLTFVGLPPNQLPPAALLLLPMLMAWAGHSMITELRAGFLAFLVKRIGGSGK